MQMKICLKAFVLLLMCQTKTKRLKINLESISHLKPVHLHQSSVLLCMYICNPLVVSVSQLLVISLANSFFFRSEKIQF